MRIDKFLTASGKCSRKDATRLSKKGAVTVNGRVVKDLSIHIDPLSDTVTLNGEAVIYEQYTYIMMNKPEGYVSSTDDAGPTVIDLLSDELKRKNLFPCGRLDKYTTGLIILTNNGKLAHRLLSPKHHAKKVYSFSLLSPLSEVDRLKLEEGVDIGDGEKGKYITLPCTITMTGEKDGEITLVEGKYHQIKRMAESVGNKIVRLERISFAGIPLDASLARGEYRPLTSDERALITCGCEDL